MRRLFGRRAAPGDVADPYEELGAAARNALSVTTSPEVAALYPSPPAGVREIMTAHAGTVFAGGRYRLLRLDEVEERVRECVALVPAAAGRLRCFATDWLGRDWGYYTDDDRIVVVEPHSGDLLSAPYGVLDFHVREIATGLLEDDLWAEWLSRNAPPTEAQCVGLTVPVFLGGELVLSNLSLSDRAVYWEICTQLARQVADLPPGTRIDSVRLED